VQKEPPQEDALRGVLRPRDPVPLGRPKENRHLLPAGSDPPDDGAWDPVRAEPAGFELSGVSPAATGRGGTTSNTDGPPRPADAYWDDDSTGLLADRSRILTPPVAAAPAMPGVAPDPATDPAPPVDPPAPSPPPVTPLQFQKPDRPPPTATVPGARTPRPEGDRQVRIGLWGAARGGKTTFLAALQIACLMSPDDWLIHGATPRANKFLADMMKLLAKEGSFPPPSQLVDSLSWHVSGQPRPRPTPPPRKGLGGLLPGRRHAEPADAPVSFLLELQDIPGNRFQFGEDNPLEEEVLASLSDSEGILYLYDPTRDAGLQRGEDGNLSFFHEMLEHLQTRLRSQHKVPPNGKLPHCVAVCLTKFDDPEVFEPAMKHQWVSAQAGTGHPWVPDNQADAYFEWLCERMPTARADLVRAALRKHFHPDRVAYFVCSAIGFRREDGGRFNPVDYGNVVWIGDQPRIRDGVRPINVLEPVIGLERRIRTGSW
jgi:hypothetical protein